MKNKLLALLLALLLCLSLCACGSYGANDGLNDSNVTDDGIRNETDGRGETGKNASSGMHDDVTDMLPDSENGFVDDNSGSDGILDGELSMPSPNVTNRH